MSVNVKLSENLVEQAKRYALIQHRSLPKQIEYWSRIEKIAEANTSLTDAYPRYAFICANDQEVTSTTESRRRRSGAYSECRS